MAKGGDSLSEVVSSNPSAGLDGHFFTLICFKIFIVCLKRPKIKEKEAKDGPFEKQFSIPK